MIRLRAAVHVGPLSLPDHRGDAINEVCRLLDSQVARASLTVARDYQGGFLATVVSEAAFRRTVRAGRTPDSDEEHFLRATTQVHGKAFEEPCWLSVPQMSASACRAPGRHVRGVPHGHEGLRVLRRRTTAYSPRHTGGALVHTSRAHGQKGRPIMAQAGQAPLPAHIRGPGTYSSSRYSPTVRRLDDCICSSRFWANRSQVSAYWRARFITRAPQCGGTAAESSDH